MQMYIQRILCLILIPDPSTSCTAEVRIGVKNNRRAPPRSEIEVNYQIGTNTNS